MIRKISEMFPYQYSVQDKAALDEAAISTKIRADFNSARSEIKERVIAAVVKGNELGACVNDIIIVDTDPADWLLKYYERRYATEVRKGSLLRLVG